MIRSRFADICTLLLVTCMVLAAELSGEKEIIFPEITALAVGYMVSEKRSWMVNSKRMLALITICAVLGVLIVRYMGLPVVVEMIIAFAFAQILFIFGGTTFAPFISAIVLPVMLQTESWVYPVAAFLLTLSVVLFRALLIKLGIRKDEAYTPVTPDLKPDITDALIRIACAAAFIPLAFFTGFKFMAAPPLLVAFTEFSRPGNKARNVPFKTVAVLTGCALAGAVSRYILAIKIGLPLTIAAFVATVLMLVILHMLRMYMPPAGAVTILAMLIPDEAVILFPLQVFLGSAVLLLFSIVFFKLRQKA
ncbi:MAG: HPP family protein [Lachnospiraceae bacterium]|nr:HPP family protein [Lachnospiraceae bacterium]